ncbi:MAG: carotenoid oxygenase family protein [Acidobacteriota bacterium]
MNHAPGLEMLVETNAVEGQWSLGQVPPDLDGTAYWNGPARFQRGDRHYRHWLDGDGMIVAVDFRNGQARLTARYVASDKAAEEDVADGFVYRAFGTTFDDDKLIRGITTASPVNVSVLPWRGELLAFGEQGLPWRLDAGTLETHEQHTFGGRLNPISPLAAHPHVCPDTGQLFDFGVSFAAASPTLTLYRIEPDGTLGLRRRVPLDAPRSNHDFALGPRHAAFYLSPYVLDMRIMADGGTPMQALGWRPEIGARLLVLRREDGEPVVDLTLDRPGYVLHLVGAYEVDGDLMVEVVELERPVYDQYWLPDLFPDDRPATLVRFRIDLDAARVIERHELPLGGLADFPALDPAHGPEGAVWLLGIGERAPGRKFFDTVIMANADRDRLTTWTTEPGTYLAGEPIFAPRVGGGVVLVPRFVPEKRTSELLVFDAYAIDSGPIGVLPVPVALPTRFHGQWAERG